MAVSTGILLDTHTWLWLQNGQLDLRGRVRAAIEGALEDDALYACSISMLEIANVVRRGRTTLDMSLEDWFQSTLRNREFVSSTSHPPSPPRP